MSDTCIFCKIVAGQIPCYRVYEDERVLAFLDVGPLTRGHTLVIPRRHAARLEEMSGDDAAALGAVLPRLAQAVLRATGADAWQLLQNNGATAQQSVGHVHLHIIPRAEGDGLGYRWPAGKLDPDAGKRLAEEIGQAMTE